MNSSIKALLVICVISLTIGFIIAIAHNIYKHKEFISKCDGEIVVSMSGIEHCIKHD